MIGYCAFVIVVVVGLYLWVRYGWRDESTVRPEYDQGILKATVKEANDFLNTIPDGELYGDNAGELLKIQFGQHGVQYSFDENKPTCRRKLII